MKELLPAAVGALVRAALQLAAGAGIVVASNAEQQISAGLLALVALAWSIWQKKKAK